ncbi:hypothetical protein [Jatrophihabitans sp.]|uniref:hypothetical protein n=1 Tax=Jatrophihabitans sp. TaxID=1932789 RepID=UPI0030C75727|nr:hypothetical protein [Jatrophihabitans sp.]
MSAPTYPGYVPQGYPPPTPPPTPPTPQYPAAPSYPGAPGQLPQQYAQPQYPAQPAYGQQFPPAQGYPPAQFAPAQPPLAQGSIDDFYSQPSAGGGKSLSFHQKPYGTQYVGIVTRPISQGDIQQQTDTMGRPQTFKDGRPKFVMKVPLQMQPSPEHPDGLGTWFVKGQARDELSRAMAEAGAPAGPPEAGAIISITYTGERQTGAGMNPAKQVAVVYQRPNGAMALPVAPQTAQPPVPQQPVAPQGPAQQPQVQYAPQQPAYDPAAQQMAQAVGMVQQAFPGSTEVPAQQFAQPQAPAFNPPAAQASPASQPIQPPAGLSPDQVALLEQMTAPRS